MAVANLSIRIRDLDRFRLFVWELRQLHDDMRVGASPFADRLEHLVDRFTADSDDEGTGMTVGHGHDLPDADGPRERLDYDDGCFAEPTDDGGWVMNTIDIDVTFREEEI